MGDKNQFGKYLGPGTSPAKHRNINKLEWSTAYAHGFLESEYEGKKWSWKNMREPPLTVIQLGGE